MTNLHNTKEVRRVTMFFAYTFSFVLIAGICSAQQYGSPASIEQFPSLVQIEIGMGPLWVQTCAGGILTSRHILSAARCFAGPLANPRLRRVRAGATHRGGSTGFIIDVESVTNHPTFGTNQLNGDITVVRLGASLNFGNTIQQASIHEQNTILPDSSSVIYAGWGNTAEGSIVSSTELHSINLTTVNHEACVAKYASLMFPVSVTSSMMCVRQPSEEGARYGLRDVGGPVYFNGVMVGIVSFGSPVGNSYPLVTTQISSYTNWIVKIAV